MIISEAIKRARKYRLLTQKELAEASGLSVSAIKFFEQGRSEPNAGSLKKMAKALDVSIDYLVGKTDDPLRKTADAAISMDRMKMIEELLSVSDIEFEKIYNIYKLIKGDNT